MGLCKVSKKVEDVLLALYEKPLTRREIQLILGLGGGTTKQIVDWLLEKGLAEEKIVSRYRVELVLTEKGRRLAQLVKEISRIVGDGDA